ncbi:MAG: di-heme enzyme [Alphaproteobacteria bacterium]|nr:di-heme enzyme [Alphaproteobacteria bacterium]
MALIAGTACTRVAPPQAAPAPTPWTWDLPDGVPLPAVPASNPMTVEAVRLGRALFFSPTLSRDGSLSCASCHVPSKGFADGRALSPALHGTPTHRNSPGLQNAAWYATLTWMNPALGSLEQQVIVPLYGEAPLELGLVGHEAEVFDRLRADPALAQGFAAAWPEDDAPVTRAHVAGALASYVRSLASFDSAYDRYLRGAPDSGMSDDAIAGMDLFFSERTRCGTCHGGFLLSSSVRTADAPDAPAVFENNGLYDLDGHGAYPMSNRGLFEITGEPTDQGRFRPPALRNVALTGPYMHDGSASSLDEIVRSYARGGRLTPSGPDAGDGAHSPLKSPRVSGFQATERELAQIVAFLDSLTDPTLLADPDARNNAPTDP